MAGMMGSPFTINGRTFDIERVDFAAPAGAVEIWEFVNNTMMAHPMHVHGVRMSMLSRGGGAVAARRQALLHDWRLSRKALVITEAELRLIASAAIIGDSNQPVNGNSSPAASGTPSAL